jgi:gas vesicle protein
LFKWKECEGFGKRKNYAILCHASYGNLLYFYFLSFMKKVVYGSIALAMMFPLISFADDSTTTLTGTTQSGSLVRPPIASNPVKALQFGIGKLSEADKTTLTTMIRDFLKSKWIELPAEVKQVRKEIKEIRKETRSEIKEMKKDTQEEVKALREKTREIAKGKREEMKEKIKDKRAGIRGGSGMTMSGTITR